MSCTSRRRTGAGQRNSRLAGKPAAGALIQRCSPGAERPGGAAVYSAVDFPVASSRSTLSHWFAVAPDAGAGGPSTARVRAAFVGERDLPSEAFKVVTETGVVYLMGLVTRAEGDRASKIASRISGVTRVVTVFEYLPG